MFEFDCGQIQGSSLIRTPPPLEPPWALGIGLLQGPTGRLFLMSEAPLYESKRGQISGVQAGQGHHANLPWARFTSVGI